MTLTPARRPRSTVSILLGALAMSGSFAALGAVILSDVAAAEAADTPAQERVVSVKQPEEVQQGETVASIDIPSEPDPLVTPEPPEKPEPKKRARKRAKVDFGRFEGY
jgi:hypothetical protein